jgi:hypothetical protein
MTNAVTRRYLAVQDLQGFRELMEANGDVDKEEAVLQMHQRLRELWVKP